MRGRDSRGPGGIDALDLALAMGQIQALYVRAVSLRRCVGAQHNLRHAGEQDAVFALDVREAVLVHLLLLAVALPALLQRLWARRVHRGLDRSQPSLAHGLVLRQRDPREDRVERRHAAIAHGANSQRCLRSSGARPNGENNPPPPAQSNKSPNEQKSVRTKIGFWLDTHSLGYGGDFVRASICLSIHVYCV